MSLTTRQWAGLAATLAVAGATVVGTVVSSSHSGGSVVPAASQTALATAAVYKWPHTIAVDTLTGVLYSGFVNGHWGAIAKDLYYCGVATDSATNKRVLTVQVEAPVQYNTLCQRALHQWDSLETKTGGKWPAGL